MGRAKSGVPIEELLHQVAEDLGTVVTLACFSRAFVRLKHDGGQFEWKTWAVGIGEQGWYGFGSTPARAMEAAWWKLSENRT